MGGGLLIGAGAGAALARAARPLGLAAPSDAGLAAVFLAAVFLAAGRLAAVFFFGLGSKVSTWLMPPAM